MLGTAGSGAGSGKTLHDMPSRAGELSSAGMTSAPAARFAENRPSIVLAAGEGKLEPVTGPGGFRRCRLLARRGQDELADLHGDLVAGFDLIERNAAIDRLAHQGIIVRNAG